MSIDCLSTTFVFTSSERSKGRKAIIIGEMTPNGDFVTHIMPATHAIWTSVQIVVVFLGTTDHRVFGATDES